MMKSKIKQMIAHYFKTKKEPKNYDFYPNHIAVLEKPPTPYSRIIAIIISLSVIIFLLWAYIGKLDVLSSAIGKLVVSGYSQQIQIYEHSRLSAIHVKNGQQVTKGEALLTLDILGVDEEINNLKNKIENLLLLKIRYQALGQNTRPDTIDDFNLLNKEKKEAVLLSYQKEKDEFDASINHINSEIETNNKNKLLTHQEINSLNELKNNIEKRFNIKKKLYDKKIISTMEFLENKKELLEINQIIKRKSSELVVLSSQEQQYIKNRDRLEKQKHLEWYDKFKQYESEVFIYQQNLYHVQKRQQLKIVRSPVTGTVQQLAVHTLGAVLQPSQAVMVIVPDTQHNVAEVNILNKDIGFIYPGQKAVIKIDAFPYTRYGTIEGTIVNIAKDSIQHEQLGLVYPVLIELDKQVMGEDEAQYKLATGMSLVADIKIEKRRVIDYLLSPIEVYQHEALREK
ncbi:HlyD family type I secretion periplasmic adaptor subunit [Proteus mirabilis]|uniref:HlyD family type I secretion periplasmic adaptor subunit n=2 Tax=Proteus mirabilis TaxID=584 RepID=UPI001A19136C|nr:HlyD family type I secretion periplasmic adaptor subunit [Proteus mirabilis]MDC5927251.1 HlyD family type I secretion periplasmic adaptor subunit [Proteus mirabilis]MDC6012243.1 HlyD family type I secretion periplasmic adaptor subunit [Proteus mirabilis]MDC6022813.1 HlyD family type I secretion periplasmic adaptor subunit [Proteus mirabilis]HAU5007541.1 HlyD family type I secretion periplasmic adaptor subunit [Proteus mirabilis]HBC5644584.1 HlyD family type I secretion periplasmic adaptor s